jgi:hypothetical protein
MKSIAGLAYAPDHQIWTMWFKAVCVVGPKVCQEPEYLLVYGVGIAKLYTRSTVTVLTVKESDNDIGRPYFANI